MLKKKKLSRLLKGLLASSLILGNVLPLGEIAIVHAEETYEETEENNFAEFISLKTDKTTYNPGEVVNLELTLSGDGELEESYYLHIPSKYSKNTFPIEDVYIYIQRDQFQLNEEGNYVATVSKEVADHTPNDDYYLNIVGTDAGRNFYTDDESIGFTVTGGTNSDVLGPEIVNITTDKETYVPGETVNITVEAKDDSPVDYVNLEYGIRFKNIRIDNFELSENGNYVGTGTFYIDESQPSATFSVSTMEAYDVLGNYSKKSEYDSGGHGDIIRFGDFEVIGENADPNEIIHYNVELMDLAFNQETYSPGETIEVSVKVASNLNLERLTMNLANRESHYDYENIYDGISIEIESLQEKSEGIFEGIGTFKIPETYPYAKYVVGDIYGYTKHTEEYVDAFNYRNSENNNLEKEIIVEGGAYRDNSPLEFDYEDLTTDKEVYRPGESIEFNLSIQNKAPMKYVSLEFSGDVGSINGRSHTVTIDQFEQLNEREALGIGYLKLPYPSISDVYSLYSFEAVDIYGNIFEPFIPYYRDNHVYFKVLADNLVSNEQFDEATGIQFIMSPEDAGRIARVNVVDATTHLIENNNIPAELKDAPFDIYDITLEDFDGVSVQPNGSVYVSIPYNEEYEVEAIYHFNNALEFIEEVDFTVTDGYVDFEADEFSYYAVAYANSEADSNDESIQPEEPTQPEEPVESDEPTEPEDTPVSEETTTPEELPVGVETETGISVEESETSTAETAGLEDEAVEEAASTEAEVTAIEQSQEDDEDSDSDDLPATGSASTTSTLVVALLALITGVVGLIHPITKREN